MLDEENPIVDDVPVIDEPVSEESVNEEPINLDTAIITVEDLKKRLRLAGIDYSSYTDEDLEAYINLIIERIEAETGLPIVNPRLITEYDDLFDGKVYETDYYPLTCCRILLDGEVIDAHKIDCRRGIIYFRPGVAGDLTVKYILVKPTEPESDATDEEKLKLEEEALNEAKEIIKKYNNGEKFEDLAKEYSDDKLTKENGGLMSNFNTDQVNESFFKAAVALKDGEITKEPIKDENGYNIILRVSQKEKAPLKDVKEEILTKLAEEKIVDEENAMIKAWLEIRKEYNLEIIDTDAKTLYKANYDNM